MALAAEGLRDAAGATDGCPDGGRLSAAPLDAGGSSDSGGRVPMRTVDRPWPHGVPLPEPPAPLLASASASIAPDPGTLMRVWLSSFITKRFDR
jgi:hypothetical protein